MAAMDSPLCCKWSPVASRCHRDMHFPGIRVCLGFQLGYFALHFFHLKLLLDSLHCHKESACQLEIVKDLFTKICLPVPQAVRFILKL